MQNNDKLRTDIIFFLFNSYNIIIYGAQTHYKTYVIN